MTRASSKMRPTGATQFPDDIQTTARSKRSLQQNPPHRAGKGRKAPSFNHSPSFLAEPTSMEGSVGIKEPGLTKAFPPNLSRPI